MAPRRGSGGGRGNERNNHGGRSGTNNNTTGGRGTRGRGGRGGGRGGGGQRRNNGGRNNGGRGGEVNNNSSRTPQRQAVNSTDPRQTGGGGQHQSSSAAMAATEMLLARTIQPVALTGFARSMDDAFVSAPSGSMGRGRRRRRRRRQHRHQHQQPGSHGNNNNRPASPRFFQPPSDPEAELYDMDEMLANVHQRAAGVDAMLANLTGGDDAVDHNNINLGGSNVGPPLRFHAREYVPPHLRNDRQTYAAAASGMNSSMGVRGGSGVRSERVRSEGRGGGGGQPRSLGWGRSRNPPAFRPPEGGGTSYAGSVNTNSFYNISHRTNNPRPDTPIDEFASDSVTSIPSGMSLPSHYRAIPFLVDRLSSPSIDSASYSTPGSHGDYNASYPSMEPDLVREALRPVRSGTPVLPPRGGNGGDDAVADAIGRARAANAARRSAVTGQEPSPGLQRIMHRLFTQMRGDGDDGNETLDLFGLFDDAFDVNPPTDVRRPDRLACPTCMSVHLPVAGTCQIAIPKEESDKSGEAAAAGVEGEDARNGGVASRSDNNGSGANAAPNREPQDRTSTINNGSERGANQSTNEDTSQTNPNPLFPRLELQLQDFIRVNTQNDNDDDDNDNDGDNEDSDASSAGYGSMPPLSSDLSSANAGTSLDSLPPLAPQRGVSSNEDNHDMSLNASNLTALVARAEAQNSNEDLGVSELTVPPPRITASRSTPPSAAARGEDPIVIPGGDIIAQLMNEAIRDYNGLMRLNADNEDQDDEDVIESSSNGSSMPSWESVEQGGDANEHNAPPVPNFADDMSPNGSLMPPLEVQVDENDAEVGDEEDSDVSSLASSMPPPEGIDNIEMNAEGEAPMLMELMDGEGVVVSRADVVEVEEVLSDNSIGESSHDSSMPPLLPAIDASTTTRPSDEIPIEAQQLARNALAQLTHPRDSRAMAAMARDVEEMNTFREFHEYMSANHANVAAEARRRLEEGPIRRDAASNRTPVLPPNPNDLEDDEHTSGGMSSASSSMPPLIRRSQLSQSSSSVPALLQRREHSSSASESNSSMPRLVRRTHATTARGGESGMSRFRRHLLERQSGDRTPTNPLTHLRDYGAIRVYATATCPICLEECNPIVALQCGHAICEDDFRRLGGYLASDKEKYKAAAAARAGDEGASSATPILRAVEETNNENLAPRNIGVEDRTSTAEARVRSLFDHALDHVTSMAPNVGGSPPRSRHGNRGIPASVTIESPTSPPQGSSPRRRGGVRGTVWTWGITRHCDNELCHMNGTLHRTLFSVGENGDTGMRHESCYTMGSKVIPDGTGGLWIQEARRVDLTENWPVIHKNRRREVEKFAVPRDADIVSDGNGGVWTISAAEQSHLREVKRYMSNSTHDVVTVPVESALYYGPGGKVWINVESDDVYEVSVDDPLEDGLWLFGSHSKQLLFSPPSVARNGGVDSDGVGNLWLLEESENMDSLWLIHILANGERKETGMQFPLGGSEVYGCGSSSGVFVFHPSSECDDFEGQLTYIYHDAEIPSDRVSEDQWTSAVIGECPTDTKFASDGKGSLWALMVDDDDECMFWKCDSVGMTPVHDWGLPFASTELVGG